ncbi:myosin-10-like [Anopheles coustani]|uniref:myosin-10-like n=1 Tax=Anopheles coustani TaxID=139045 RepID=UPI0026590B81|nr:myosin-10-like [Anopheles coustani]
MAEAQQTNQTNDDWRLVVLEWVKCSKLHNTSETIRLDSVFDAFRKKIIETNQFRETNIIEFLRTHFPRFELKLNKCNEIPDCDNVYVFSLMLYFSCVRLPIEYFQNVCKTFSDDHQRSVKTFLDSFLTDFNNKIHIDRCFLDTAFSNATNSARNKLQRHPEPKVERSSDAQIFSSTPASKLEHKMPSPQTPKNISLEWKMKNLTNLLDSARSENGTLEKQNEQLVQRIQELNEDKQKLLMKIKAMQLTEQQCETNSGSKEQLDANDRQHELCRKKLEKNNELIELLHDEINKAKENACIDLEQLSAVKTNNIQLKRDMQCLESTIETLNKELSRQGDIIESQAEVINDLRRFIRESRLACSESLAEPLESSFECFDKFSELSIFDESRCQEPENLASTVVEVKLREQEIENEKLMKQIEQQMLEIKQSKENRNLEAADFNAKLLVLQRDNAKMNAMVAELQKSLLETVESKKQLEQTLEKQEEDYKRTQMEINAKVSELQKSLMEKDDNIKQLDRQLEDHKCSQMEMNAKVAELQKSLVETVETKRQLEQALKKQEEDHKHAQMEMNVKIAELQQSLAEVVNSKKQLEQAFEKQEEYHNRAQMEMNVKDAELQNLLSETVDSKKQLEQAPARQEEDLKSVQMEMNLKVAELQKSLVETVKTKKQLEEALEKQVEDHKRAQTAMNVKVAELQKLLVEAVDSKKHLEQALAKQEEDHKRAQMEMNAKVPELQKILAETVDSKKQLEQALAKQEEDHKRIQTAMNVKVAELQTSLADTVETKKLLEQTLEKKVEDHERAQMEMNTKVAELQKSLMETVDSKKHLEQALAKQEEDHKCSQMELNAKVPELQKILADTVDSKKQLEQALAKHEEDHKRVQMEMNRKVAELQKSLAETVETKKQLEQALEKQEEDYKHAQIEMNVKVAELQKSLAEVVNSKKQLELALEKQEENHNRAQMEMNVKDAELQKLLSETVDSKKHVEQALAKREEDLKRVQLEMNAKVAVLQKSLVETVKTKKQLEEALEKQMEDHKFTQTAMDVKVAELQKSLAENVDSKKHLELALEKQVEDYKRVQMEMNRKVAELQKSLAETVQTKKQLEEALEKQVEDHKRVHMEMNSKVPELQKLLAEMVNSKKQLEQALEKQEEDHKCTQREMNVKVAELQKSLSDTVETKKQLEQTLEKQVEDHKHAEMEMNLKVAELQKLLAETVDNKKQLEQTVEKQQDAGQREQEKLYMKTAELQNCLKDADATKQQLKDTLEHQYRNVRDLTVQLQNLSKEHGEECSKRDELDEKSEELSSQFKVMKKKADDLESQCIKLLKKVSTQNEEIVSLREELEKKGATVQVIEEKDAQLRQLHSDCEILAGKLYVARTQLEENRDAREKEVASALEKLDNLKKSYEEQIREARIVTEDKMERMKERMKEIHKEKLVKLERERQELFVSLEQSYKERMENLESRCATLQKQVAEMNERDLQCRKENQLLQAKVKTLEESRGERKSSLLLPPPARLRCNLKMEDEESEVFNNTYLADLQNGRCTSPTTSDGGFNRASELMRRNSMRLPHLRTTYTALEPDIELPADDTRENLSSLFDDSSTGLITRRKVSGITSYKRPGPPTPSKKAGRLSLGGVLPGANLEIQYKDALQDANVAAGTTEGLGRTGRTKTPGKFKQMLSSSSLLSNFQRDEGHINDVTPVAFHTIRCSAAIRHSKRVSLRQQQRSVRFDLHRARGFTTADEDPTSGAVDDRIFGAVSERSLPLPPSGNSLHNIRQQQMLRRDQRNRLLDLRRKIEGSPLRYQPQPLATAQVASAREMKPTDGAVARQITQTAGVARTSTSLYSIPECLGSAEKEEEDHDQFGVAETSCWSYSFISTMLDDDGTISMTTNRTLDDTGTTTFLSALSECSMPGSNRALNMRRREQRNRQVDLPRRLDVFSPLLRHDRDTTAGLTTPLSSTLITDVTDSGLGLDHAGSARSISNTNLTPAPKALSPTVLVFLSVAIAVGLLAEIFYFLYLPPDPPRHFSGDRNQVNLAWCETLKSVNQAE